MFYRRSERAASLKHAPCSHPSSYFTPPHTITSSTHIIHPKPQTQTVIQPVPSCSNASIEFSQLIALISSRARNRQPKAHPPITAHLRCGTWATPPESDPLSDWWMWQRLIRPTRDKIRRIENLRIPIPTEAETQTKGNTGRFEQSSWGQTDVPYSWWDDVAETKRNVELSPDQQLTGNQIWCSDLRHVCRGTWPKRKTVEGLQLWLMIHSIIDHFNIFTLIFLPSLSWTEPQTTAEDPKLCCWAPLKTKMEMFCAEGEVCGPDSWSKQLQKVKKINHIFEDHRTTDPNSSSFLSVGYWWTVCSI